MMATTLALGFLTIILFFVTNGQGIVARDLKVELREQKEVDVPYITRYITTKPNDAAIHTTTKHNNHLSHHQNINPYIDGYNGYKTSPSTYEASQPNYIAGYRTHTHDSNGLYTGSYDKYKTHSDNSNGPYTASYGNQEDKKHDYIAGYRTHTHDSNGLYTGGYDKYKTHSDDSNGPYTASYGNQDDKKHDYIAGYRTHTHDSNGPYIAGYRTHTYDSNGLYAGSYEGDITRSHDLNGPYITTYGGDHDSDTSQGLTSTNLEDPKSSSSGDSKGPPSPIIDRTEAFKVGIFTLDDLYIGNVMTLQFPIQEVSPFLSKKEADSIPLSMSHLSSVLQLFSIPEDSPEAKSIRGTVEQCEDEPITGETKICAKSLESMLEFVDKVIGSDTNRNILTTSYPSPSAIALQKYTILEVSHDINTPKWVACHPLPYPYAIHYCHFISTGTKVFKVSLVGENNGDKMEALGVCHLDTSAWSPDHKIFRQLGIKAGKDQPICHFFPVKHLMWVS